MAQLTTANRMASLRAAPSFGERIDLPRRVVFLAAASMIGIVVLLLGFITWQGLQLFLKDGVPVTQVLSSTWQPDSTSPDVTFGLLPFIAGTVFVTAVALLISTPLSVGLALFLSEVAPRWARAIVQPALEIFVGIPSVVWGWLGITILVPFLSDTFHHDLALSLPVVGEVFRAPASSPASPGWPAPSSCQSWSCQRSRASRSMPSGPFRRSSGPARWPWEPRAGRRSGTS